MQDQIEAIYAIGQWALTVLAVGPITLAIVATLRAL